MVTFTKRSALLLGALLIAATAALPGAVAAATATVRITDRLEPATLRVAQGTTVVWRNDSGERHRMRSVDHSGDADWDTGNIEPGERASVRFPSPGTFAYVDERDDDNPAYHGTVIVTAAGGGASGGGGGATPSQPVPPVDPGAPPATTTPTTATVSMAGRVFSPRSITIAAGGTVTFSNDDDDDHTATAPDLAWDSGVLAPGAAFDRRFPTPGTFGFLCLIHPEMQGTIEVRAAGTTEPEPAQLAPTPTPRPTTPPAPSTQPTSPPAAAGPETADIAMVDLAFEPATLEAVAGDTIRWTNEGAAPHTATAEDGAFDSGIVPSGGAFEVTLDTPGTYAYVCQLHSGMSGSIVVTARAGSPTGTGANPSAAAAATGEPSAEPSASGAPASSVPSPEASTSVPPVAVAGTGPGSASTAGSAGSASARDSGGATAPARASFDLTRLGVVILLVGGAMALFGKIVRSVVRPG